MHGRLAVPGRTTPPPRAGAAPPPFTRAFWVIVHRWAGLTIALFLIVAGFTGAIMPFEETLGYATRPDAAQVAPHAPAARPLDAVAIAERVERQTGGRVSYLPLDVPRDHAMRVFVSPRAGAPPLGYDVVWVDPFSGRVRLTYTFGGVRDGVQDIVPFLYSVHYGAVAGAWGVFAFGLAALVWTANCLVGFGLSLPSGRRGWWRRFGQVFAIRRWSGFKLTFDLHRAGGLWLWPLLLVFAWAAVALAIPQVETPVRRLLGGEGEYEAPALKMPLEAPPLGRRAAIARGLDALTAQGRRDGFAVERPTTLYYLADSGSYRLYARTTLDPSHDKGHTQVVLDARDGRVLHYAPPTGRTAADRAVAWAEMLHRAQMWGLPYRIFVSAFGLLVAALSATGVMIWQRKRAARLAHRARPTARGRRPGAEPIR
ncbi:PepSY-associated TM helix domain-containing protein [Sphingomonas sp.]|uniref:PepSY-associated TM helix domain-containing protein n=1 Tax=Sphingomonas sp. TaxID=28214 RepID=UPI003B000034